MSIIYSFKQLKRARRSAIAESVIQVLQNAFIQALQPAIDNQISIASVAKKRNEKGLLATIFNKPRHSNEKRKTAKN